MFECITYHDILGINDRMDTNIHSIDIIRESIVKECKDIMEIREKTPWIKIVSIMTTAWYFDNDTYQSLCNELADLYVTVTLNEDEKSNPDRMKKSISKLCTNIPASYRTLCSYLDNHPECTFNNFTMESMNDLYEVFIESIRKKRDSINDMMKLSVKMRSLGTVEKILDKCIQSTKTIEFIMNKFPELCMIDDVVKISKEHVREYGDEFFPDKMAIIRENGKVASTRRLLILKREYRKVVESIKAGVDDITLLEMYPYLVKDNRPNIDSTVLKDFSSWERDVVKTLRQWENSHKASFEPYNKGKFINDSWIYNGITISKDLKTRAIQYVEMNHLPESIYVYRAITKKLLAQQQKG